MMNTRRETSIQVQTVLFCNDTYSLLRSLKHMANAVRVARQNGVEVHVRVAWGDASPEPLFDETALNEIRQKYSEELELNYTFFHRNTGTSLGHNTLAKNCTDEYLLVMNPDIVPSPTFFMEILKPFEHKGSTPVGAVEARQTPLEHQKTYHPDTGETDWNSGACTLYLTKAFQQVHGYDADSFFLYCDDVDLSFRIRLAGYTLLYQPSAVVYHDKRLDENGIWASSEVERNYSAEARLLMTWKWSFPKELDQLLKHYKETGAPEYRFALQKFEERRKNNTLPAQLDPEHRVGFVLLDDNFDARYDRPEEKQSED